MSFTHLHVHSEYSLLDGVSKIEKILAKAKSLGMESIAVTDHGVMNGACEFWAMAKDFNIKPIIGCEIYVSPKEKELRSPVNGIKYYHLILLAKNFTGYRNLMKIVSIGHLEGYYYRPRVDKKILKKYSEGLICTSACLAGPISRHLLRREEKEAISWLEFLDSTFKNNFYLELQRHGYNNSDEFSERELIEINKETDNDEDSEESIDNIIEQKYVNQKLLAYSEKYKIPILATTDSHYTNEDEKELQQILFAIKDGKLLSDDSCRNGYVETYILPQSLMQEKFSDLPDAIKNSMVISDQIETYSIAFDRVQPKYSDIPSNSNSQKELKKEVFIGAVKKYCKEKTQKPLFKEIIKKIENHDYTMASKVMPIDLINRLELELNVIHQKGYDDYFLVVSDIMRWCASKDILVGVRGSVAGSVAAHCLDIVEIDPIEWELYFERFLNPERPSPPDIDMDIQDDRRDEVIEYVENKYGKECVAAICAIGRLKTKAAIRDVSRVMGIDLKTADNLSKMVTVLFGKPYTISKMLDTNPEFKKIIESDEILTKMSKYVQKIENIARHLSVHACGYLITPGPITDYVPLHLETGGDREVVQYEGPWLEVLGLMKFDFLGLRTLTIISNALKIINKNRNSDLNFYNIPSFDKKTFELFSDGNTAGVFQFESPPMQQYLRDLKPETLEDLCFMVAAYRPGPMKYIPDYIKRKHGEAETEYLIPELKEIVGNTYGCAIYQEQVIKIAVDLAGYSMGGADVLRRAMGKKKLDVMKKEEVIFKEGIKKKGYGEKVAQKLWEYMLPFADYGFNKAHAAGYAVLAFKCAYLKAHYPLEFITALMQSDLENQDRITIDLIEAKRLGFNLLPPSINKSQLLFFPENKKDIRFGLGAIKNVGTKVCQEIIREREENGIYMNLEDFLYRNKEGILNKRVLESLIKSGALDEFGDRAIMLNSIQEILQKINLKSKEKDSSQESLFGENSSENYLKIKLNYSFPKATDKQKISWEKEYLGLYLTLHPLSKFSWVYLNPDIKSINDLQNHFGSSYVKTLATISQLKVTYTKPKNEKMCILKLEDFSGSIEAVLFPKYYVKYQAFLQDSIPLLIEGRVNERNDKKSIIIQKIDHANVIKRPTNLTIDLRKVKDSYKLELLKKIQKVNGKDSIEIIYGKSKKRIKIETDFSIEQNVNIIKNFI